MNTLVNISQAEVMYMFKKEEVDLSKFKKLNTDDNAQQRADKIIHFMENEGGFQSNLKDGKLEEFKRQYILEKEQGLHNDKPPKFFSTGFIMSVKIAREMLSPNNEDIANFLHLEYK